MPLVLGSDWPVAPFDPRRVLADAQLRRPAGEPDVVPVQPHQGLTPLMALQGYTTWAARAVGEEGRRGQVRPGMAADLTVWGEDPVACAADDLPEDPVLLTVVDGEVVHRDAVL